MSEAPSGTRDTTPIAPDAGDPAAAPVPRCLVVTKEFSRTPTSGGMLRTLAIVEQLARHYDTTVVSPSGVVMGGPGTPLGTPAGGAVPDDAVGPGSGSGSGAGATLGRLRAVGRYRSLSGARTGGTALLANLRTAASGRYQVGVVDHTCLAGLLEGVAAGCDRVVLSTHNVESDLMAQRARSAGSAASRLAMRVETQALRRLEARTAGRFPIMVTTEADARALPAGAEVIVCRNGIFPQPPAEPGPPPAGMVFSGALDWEPNITGLLWFLAECWPALHRQAPQARLTIAGRHPDPAVRAAVAEHPGVSLLADPPVMADVLARHALGIVPLLNGGGSRIKILEYLAVGLDVVSTQVGASGLEDIPDDLVLRVPEDPELLLKQLLAHLESPPNDAARARSWVQEHYAWQATLRPLLEALGVR